MKRSIECLVALLMGFSVQVWAQSSVSGGPINNNPQCNKTNYSAMSAVWFCNGKYFDDSFGQIICQIHDKTIDTIHFSYLGGQMRFNNSDLEKIWSAEQYLYDNHQDLKDTDCLIMMVFRIHPYSQTCEGKTIMFPIPYSQIGPFREMESSRLQFFVTMINDDFFVYVQNSDGYRYCHTTQKGRRSQRSERKLKKEHYRQYNLKNGLLGRMWD